MRYLIAVFGLMGWLVSGALGQEQETVKIQQESGGTCAAPCPRTAVLFVHGMTGGRDTWQAPNTEGQQGAFWPNLLGADPQIGAKLDIYTVSYNSYRIQQSPSVSKIQDQLNAKLDPLLFVTKKYSKIILICHSLGGILCHQYVFHIKQKYSHKYVSLFGLVITLGTPLNGASVASYVASVSRNPQWQVLRPVEKNAYLQLLESMRAEWDEKRNSVCGDLKNYAAVETQPYWSGPVNYGILVPKESAIPNDPKLRSLVTISKSFPTKDHVNLVKPAGYQDDVYVWAKAAISECLDGAICKGVVSADCPGRFPDWIARP